MISTQIFGFYGEGRILCHECAKRLYGTSLEKYLAAGDLQTFTENDQQTYASEGLLCDDCLGWILRPDKVDDCWWREEPDPAENIRLLATFAAFLETLEIDVENMR